MGKDNQRRLSQLQIAQQRVELVAKVNRQVIRDWAIEQDRMWWSESVHSFFGYRPEQLGTNLAAWLDCIHPENREQIRRYLSQTMQRETDTWFARYRFRKADDTYVWVAEQGSIQWQHGKASRLISTMEPIDDRSMAECEDPSETKANERLSSQKLRQSISDTNLIGLSILQVVRDSQRDIQDFRIQLVNKGLEQLTHRTDLRGKLYTNEFPGTKQNGLFELMVRVIETGEPGQIDYYYPFDGATKWLSSMFIKFEDGLLATNLDVTERKQAEAENRKNSVLLHQTEELADMGSWEYDRQTSQFTWSAGMYHLFSIPTHTAVSPAIYVEAAIDADKPVAQRIADYIQHGTEPFEEVIRIQRGTQEITLKVKGTILEDLAGRRALGVDWDITELIQYQTELQYISENLQAVLDTSPAFIGMFNAVYEPANSDHIQDFKLTVANQKLAHLVHLTLPDIVGQSIQQFGAVLWNGETLSDVKQVYQTGQTRYDEKYIRNESDERWIAISVCRQDGGVMMTGMDITELKQVQQQQQYWLEELEKASESTQALTALRLQLRDRGELLRATSHDLRGHVGVIGSAAQLLGIVNTEEEREQMIQMIQRNMLQMTQLMTSLLDFARLESGQQTRTISSFDPSELLTELGETITLQAQQQGLWVRIEGPANLMVQGDTINVRRVVQNLLLNAIKYTTSGGVTLSWGKDTLNQQWWVCVEDTGPGLSTNLLNRLNRSLEQLNGAESAGAENSVDHRQPLVRGEGIGLRIVQELVLLLEAKLNVISQPGDGTRFQIYFPLKYA